tara:strand:- start:132 stop:1292 length:1161 start_codon:yes stop_codon:yes gene_type:complete
MKKIISILGSTGSVGKSTLAIVDKKKNYFKINLLSANSNFKLISEQINKYKPNIFVVKNQEIFKKIKFKFRNKKIKIINKLSEKNLLSNNDITISAIPGLAGLEPTLLMIKKSKKILIANKESIICGWNLIQKKAKKNKTQIIPVDSEHYSIMKLLENHKMDEIKKIYLTASGGPFLNYNFNKLKKVTPKLALKHPKWKMGKKISIDSATLMNKILELIEAQKLFSIPNSKIDILIHPNSLVHAIIHLRNGLIKLLYHDTSMVIPLANAIFEGKLDIEKFYKRKKNTNEISEKLIFKKVDKKIFPVIKLKDRLNEYPSTPIIINAANEMLVGEFLKKKMPYLNIYKHIFSIMNDSNYKKYAVKNPLNIAQIFKIDSWAKSVIRKKI